MGGRVDGEFGGRGKKGKGRVEWKEGWKWKGGKEGLGMAVELSNPLRYKSIVKID